MLAMFSRKAAGAAVKVIKGNSYGSCSKCSDPDPLGDILALSWGGFLLAGGAIKLGHSYLPGGSNLKNYCPFAGASSDGDASDS